MCSETRQFWNDVATGHRHTYGELVRDVGEMATVPERVSPSSSYATWVVLLASIICDTSLTLMDTHLEARATVPDPGRGGSRPSSPESLLDAIRQSSPDWRLELFTSGTTGRPKSVRHSVRSLTRGVQAGPAFESATWAFAYHPTHFAGLQVFFQALMNLNEMVYVFDLPASQATAALSEHHMTHISATPTWYRTKILPSGLSFPDVTRVTVGGERSDATLLRQLRSIFPSATLRNVYASTEAGSLFATRGEDFVIPEALRNQVRIGDDGQLLLRRDLLAEAQAEEWYATGDIVERTGDDRFRFVGRVTEMVNVGGYKINPLEVEDAIRKVDGVADVAVVSQPNSVTGSMLIATIKPVSLGSQRALEAIIRKQLQSTLQPFEIPRIYRFVDDLDTARTGKLKRS